MKIIEENEKYVLLEHQVNGKPIIFRFRKNRGLYFQVKVTDFLAKETGFESVEDMGRKLHWKYPFPKWMRSYAVSL